MDQTLVRVCKAADGIRSRLVKTETGEQVVVTLTHAYDDGAGGWEPVIPNGRYECMRGLHRLESMTHDFETFEVTNVAGHTKVLFHSGAWQSDSRGCELTGEALVEAVQPGMGLHEMVTHGHAAFATFMASHEGEDTFWLDVVDEVV